MKITSIRLEKDTKGLLDKIKDKYDIPTYNLCVHLLSVFSIKNNINPKEDYTGEFQNGFIQLEIKLKAYLEEMQKKLTNDNTTLRKWVGGITKNHLVPMQKQIYYLSQNSDLGKINKTAEKIETPKVDLTPKSYLTEPKTESAKEKELAEKLEKSNQESMELYRRYEEQKNALFKIFENSKVEQIGMTGTKTRIVVELSEQEWKELKEVI
jgi:hypothetical protein